MSDKKHLKLDDDFTFACHAGLECYTSCCRDVTIMLTPNDVMRLKKALGITSGEFMQKYATLVEVKGKLMPLVQLAMNEANDKKCHFVKEGFGCTVYEDRPWACRMFPLDERAAGGFEVVTNPERCHGLVKGDPWKVRDWLRGQGATQSKEADGSWESLVSHVRMQGLNDVDNPQVQQMLMMALYDLDRFREFVFNSSFLDRFEMDEDTLFAIKTDEEALLDLGYRWVRFGLLGQKTLELTEQAKAALENK